MKFQYANAAIILCFLNPINASFEVTAYQKKANAVINPQPLVAKVPLAPQLTLIANLEHMQKIVVQSKTILQDIYDSFTELTYSFNFIDSELNKNGDFNKNINRFYSFFHVLTHDQAYQACLMSDAFKFQNFTNDSYRLLVSVSELACSLIKNAQGKQKKATGKKKTQDQNALVGKYNRLNNQLDELLDFIKTFTETYNEKLVSALENDWRDSSKKPLEIQEKIKKAENQAQPILLGRNARPTHKRKLERKQQEAMEVCKKALLEFDGEIKKCQFFGAKLADFEEKTLYLRYNNACKTVGKLGVLHENTVRSVFDLLESSSTFKNYIQEGIQSLLNACCANPEGAITLIYEDLKMTLQAYITHAYVTNADESIRGKTRGTQYELICALYCYQNGLGLQRINFHIELDDLNIDSDKEFDLVLDTMFIEIKNRDWQRVSAEETAKVKRQIIAQQKIAESHGKKFVLISSYPLPRELTEGIRNLSYVDPTNAKQSKPFSKLFTIQDELMGRA